MRPVEGVLRLGVALAPAPLPPAYAASRSDAPRPGGGGAIRAYRGLSISPFSHAWPWA